MKRSLRLCILFILVISLLVGCSKKDELVFGFKDMNEQYINKVDDEFRKLTNDYFKTIAAYHTTYNNGDKENAITLLDLNYEFRDELRNQINDYDPNMSDEQFKMIGDLLEFDLFVLEKSKDNIADVARNLATKNNSSELSEDDKEHLESLKKRYQTFITKYYE